MKKSNKILGISILALVLLLLVGVLAYSFTVDSTNEFHPNRTGMGRILYERVMELDAYVNFPRTPTEVMEMQADILMLLYGDFIVDETLFADVLRQQRLLFSDELLELNSFEMQHRNFMGYLDTLRDDEIRAISTDVLPMETGPLENFAVMRVTQSFSNLGTVYWIYHLERENSHSNWKINAWTTADENFSAIW